jgi:site-specific DNA recombinase
VKAPKQPEAKRCAIYTRKSTTLGLEQEFNSLDAQRERCHAYIGTQPGWVLTETYEDGGFTGANTDRPGFQKLLADIAAKKLDVVLVYKVDRLSRSLLDFAKMMDVFNAAGVAFVSVTQNFSTADAIGRLTLNMMMSFAEFEREMIAERTRDKVHAARRKGKWTGGPVPIGYDLVDGKLVVNPLEAVVVQEVFSKYLETRSLFAVLDALYARGRETKRYVGKSGAVRQSKAWDKRGVARTLKNPIYVGQMPCGDEVFDGEHQAIIPRETFDEVQALIGAGREYRPQKPTSYLLKGLMRCGACGAALSPASSNRRGREYRYYRCKTRELRGAKACPTMPISARAIEPVIIQRIRDATANVHLAADVERHLVAKTRADRAALLEEQRGVPALLNRQQTEAEKLTATLIAAPKASKKLIQQRLTEVAAQIERTEQRQEDVAHALAELQARKVEGEWLVQALRNFDGLWEVMTADNRHRLVGAVVEKVVVSGGGDEVDVDIQLATLGEASMEKAS